jgi:hypothetical protein
MNLAVWITERSGVNDTLNGRIDGVWLWHTDPTSGRAA